MKPTTDKKKIKELLTRGVEVIYPSSELLEKKLLSGERIKLYCGFDPSAPALHIGHAILINKLAQFQKLGHEVIFLIGDFTGMIGDPTDKASVRKKLTREDVLANATDYKKQASAYLDFDSDNPAKILYNSEWNDKLTFADLIELTSNFTVQQMIQRDMFQKRLEDEKPIHLHEFLYPLTQAYDSVAMDVDLEVGGNDQMFNMMCGRDLMKALGKKEKFVITMKLLADDKGKKMGKSEGNAVFLDTNPKDMYGTVMSWPDGAIIPGFELCTNAEFDEIKEMENEIKNNSVNPRDLKMKLAFLITAMNHGEEKSKEAEEHFVNTVQKKEVPEEIVEKIMDIGNWKLLDLLTECGLASSKGEAKRLIVQNGIRIDGKAVNDINMEIEITKDGILLQRGKRQFVRAIFRKGI